jgi:hypothetical protein
MKKLLGCGFLTAVLAVGWASGARADADADAALAHFKAGKAAANAGNDGKAIAEFKKALKSFPDYYQAHRALGKVYESEGKKDLALAQFKAVLTLKSDDAYALAAVKRLKGDDEDAPGSAEVAPKPKASRHRRTEVAEERDTEDLSGFSVHVPLMAMLSSSSDMSTYFTNQGGSASGGNFAWGVGIGGDYCFKFGLVLGADILDGPHRSGSGSIPGGYYNAEYDWVNGNDTVNYSVDQDTLLFTPGWRFHLAPKFYLEPRLGLGLSFITFNVSDNSNYSDYNYTTYGTSFVFWPEVRAEYLVATLPWEGQIGVGAEVGYFYGTSTQVSDIWGYDTSIQTNGLTLQATVDYHFKPAF